MTKTMKTRTQHKGLYGQHYSAHPSTSLTPKPAGHYLRDPLSRYFGVIAFNPF